MNIAKSRLAAGVVFASALYSLSATAQDSAFLACAQFNDRGQRIACLEDALEAAVSVQGSNAEASPPAASPTAAPRTSTASVVPQAPAAPPASEPAPAAQTSAPTAAVSSTTEQESANAVDEPSLMDRLRNFGQKTATTITSDAEGNDQLHDTITTLEKRNNLWLVTLASGQVWRQEVPRTLNLREGDAITIYQAGLGNGYRMATERLNGFIRVERLK